MRVVKGDLKGHVSRNSRVKGGSIVGAWTGTLMSMALGARP